MQDRFKFRVWDNKTREMYEVKNMSFFGHPIFTLRYKPVYKVGESCGVLMQCTGLKDKNGVLIYEGDVLEFTDIDGDIFTKVVNWQCASWFASGQPLWYITYKDVVSAKVIGNIYEHPHLLEETEK